MPFELFNTLIKFKSFINNIFAQKLDVFIIIYINDIFIYIGNLDQYYTNNILQIIKELQKANLFANLKKCCFYKNEVQLLAYVIILQETQIEFKKLEAIKNQLEPKSMQDI